MGEVTLLLVLVALAFIGLMALFNTFFGGDQCQL